MKILLALLFLSSISAQAATETQRAPSANRSTSATDKTKEPSSIPCIPQQTRGDKLNDLAKLEGAGESHSTNCPAQGTIKEAPDAPPSKTE